MIIKKDLYLVCEVPFIEPKFGCTPERGVPEVLTITTTRDEAYKIASRYVEYKNFRNVYSVVFISYYNGPDGEYWGSLYRDRNLDNIVAILGADAVDDKLFTGNCPLYFNNPVSHSFNILRSMEDFRKVCNWVKAGLENFFAKMMV